ncbi:hypothetical protein [Amycolatopsis sp. FDAARGOS 1241]|uniref:hypothetical protein n=1 Tax=Amycolatopsis sp. FDAARGOS 1241 TaxID=2778070 RepID=UPI00194F13EE|nr:hypothetical protein [Amycolatopsis sp. FDAARGOS 1241]QRP44841.1 hypothetical protein I6J71_37365 [Amycolatopsis sp. FDAARGOS 1241]
MESTITEKQAHDRVEDYVREAFAAPPAPASRTLFSQNRAERTDPTDGGPPGRFEISVTYAITGLAVASFGEQFDAVVTWWRSHGSTVVTDKRPGGQYVFARNTSDSFDMSIQADDLGKLYLGATSPRVWPNGVPDAAPARERVEEPEDMPAAEAPKPRPRRAPGDEEDFGETNWSDGGAAY